MLARLIISSQNNPIYVCSSETEDILKLLCKSSAEGGQGNALPDIAFPVAINEALKETKFQHDFEVRA